MQCVVFVCLFSFWMDGGFADGDASRCRLSSISVTFHFGLTFSPCSTQELSSSQTPAFAALKISGHPTAQKQKTKTMNVAKQIAPVCVKSHRCLCYQTSRAATVVSCENVCLLRSDGERPQENVTLNC